MYINGKRVSEETQYMNLEEIDRAWLAFRKAVEKDKLLGIKRNFLIEEHPNWEKRISDMRK